MFRAWAVFVLVVLAGAAPAQQMFKCKLDDGTMSYQQSPCAVAGQQQSLRVYAPPPPTPVRNMVQAIDPETGQTTQMWMDGPAPPTTGGTYTTREMRQVFDPETGIPH